MGPRGFTLVEIMIAMGVLSIGALGLAEIMTQSYNANRDANIRATARLVRQNFAEMLGNDLAWKNSVAAPENAKAFQCIVTAADCRLTARSPELRPFVIHDPSGGVFYDGMAAGSGLSENGASCSGYPSAACPFQMQLNWIPVCPGQGPCLLPEIQITAALVYSSPAHRLAYNPSNYSVSLYRATAQAPVSAADVSQVQSSDFAITAQAICGLLQNDTTSADVLASLTRRLQGMGLSPDAIQQYLTRIQGACASGGPTSQ